MSQFGGGARERLRVPAGGRLAPGGNGFTTLGHPDGRPVVKVGDRPRVAGKFLAAGGEKLYLRGVTYGTFAPGPEGHGYPDIRKVRRDFAAMAGAGVNAVRTYTVPPAWLLDLAGQHGLRVMAGLPWEQHVAFLDERNRPREIEQRVREMVRQCRAHPALLCYAVGNEIPAPIVRWQGGRAVERFLERLARAVREEDPGALVTYVNFPTTEYLELPFVDFLCFNVYLEAQASLERYLARLHNRAGDLPLVMAEIGLDSRRNGEDEQARTLDWQVRTTFEAGCAGAFVFAWTDEWHRGGYEIEDWDFGLTTRDRTPKPALAAVAEAFGDVPLVTPPDPPRFSVVVCTHNGAPTLSDCLEGVAALDYPDYEVIVVDDGSTDASAAIAEDFDCRLIRTPNSGLASARNTGLEAASGEIVAYVDDDARPDPHWLTYLAHAFGAGSHAGFGGPNIAPPDDGEIADCIANAPGGPIHVLLSDREAEHIPGCNLVVRKAALEAVDGFDPRFRAAGDDVDLCWRLQKRGWALGFVPAAMVWHRRRNSVRAYWHQQVGYGRAEALLEDKWPERYNGLGHLRWGGRIYGKGLSHGLGWRRRRVHYGTWGSRLFQSVYEPAQGGLSSLPLMPEWYLLIAALAALSGVGLLWSPLLLALPGLGLAVAALLALAALGAREASFTATPGSRRGRTGRRVLTAGLFVLQPLARLRGRLRHGLTPWRRRWVDRLGLPVRTHATVWSEEWRPQETWIGRIEGSLTEADAPVSRGGDCDRWELDVRGGLLAGARLRAAVEEHGAGRQLLRVRVWPRFSHGPLGVMTLFAALTAAAALDGAVAAAGLLGAGVATAAARGLLECAAAKGAFERALEQLRKAAAADLRALRDDSEETVGADERSEHLPRSGHD